MTDRPDTAYEMTADRRARHRRRVDDVVHLVLRCGDVDSPIGSKAVRVRTARNILKAALAEILEIDVHDD